MVFDRVLINYSIVGPGIEMIVVQCKGGLGNQLFQYAFYQAVKHRTTQPVSFDTSWYRQQTKVRFALAELLGVPYEEADKAEVLKLASVSRQLGQRVRRRFLPKKTHFIEDQSSYSSKIWDLVSRESGLYLDGYWQSHRYFNSVEDHVRRLYFPLAEREKHRQIVDSVSRERTSVSLHVRRGDYVNDKRMRLLGLDYYLSAMADMRDSLEAPVFFVASDDLGWARENLRGGDIVFVDWNQRALDDLFTMATCTHHIIANSSFSWWAAYLLDVQTKKVVYPRRWFKSTTNQSNLEFMFPNHWVSL